jgi:hypothetical protein
MRQLVRQEKTDTMRKLFVYGCSFSIAYVSNEKLPPINMEEGWPYIVAKSINYEIVDRTRSGFGYSHIVNRLNEDLMNNKISKQDIILISPSTFLRVTYPELKDTMVSSDQGIDWLEISAKYGKSVKEIVELNVMRFYLKIKLLSELGYKIYGWCWSLGRFPETAAIEKSLKNIGNNLVYTPDSTLLWEDWILDNPNCMLIPGKPLPDGSWTGDTHFSKHGHKVAADHFVKFLKKII